MAAIIGRKKEIQELQRIHDKSEASLVVVYGRRRVGKTYLVNQMFANKGFAFKVTGLYDQTKRTQLKNFTMAMRESFGNKELEIPAEWLDAFAMLKDCLISTYTGKRRVLFFDELPWMDTKSSKFLSAFEWFWNGWGCAQDDLMVVVCGSSTNWIINKLFKNKGGLFNRADSRIFLRPFTLNETEQYLKQQGFELERYDIAQIYMIMGGIPFYLKQLDPSRPIAENIDNLFFKTNGKLWDEFDSLYDTLFVHSEVYVKVVETLAKKQIGLTREEIIKQTHLPDNGMTSNVIKDLIKCGFVRSYQYYGRKTKAQTYQLADYYSLFYFRFIKDNYGQDEHFWSHLLDNPARQAWKGYGFEQIVKDHIEVLKNALGIGNVLTTQSSWHVEKRELDDDSLHGAQIDLLIDRRDRAINICEIKFADAEYVIDKDYSMNLKNKIAAFRSTTASRKSLVPTMITTYGVKKNMYSNIVQQEVVLDDLFA